MFHNHLLMSAGFTPVSLFASGEQGVWYDPSDMTTLFQDAAGTTPVTAVEQAVGLVLDKSKGLVLGPELVTNGGFTTDSDWQKSGYWTISGGQATMPSTASFLPLYQAMNFVVGRWYEIRLTFVSITGQIQVRLNDDPITVNTSEPAIFSTTGTKVFYLLAGTGTEALVISRASGSIVSSCTIDNISVRELPGNHATQSTSASRPVLSARVNLLTRTEEFNDAVWDKGSPARVTISANSTLDPLGGSTADTMTETVTNSTHRVVSSVNPGVGNISNISFKVSCSYKASSGSPYALLALTDDSGNNQIRAWFDLTSGSVGTVANVGNGSGATATISAQANGFYLCTLSGVPATTAAGTNTSLVTAFVGMADADNSISYVGNTGRSVFIWGADLRVSNAGVNLPAYQRVAAATDYDTTGFPMYLKFDGTDDSMATGTIDPGSVDKAQVFAGVRKLSDAANGVVAEWSAARATNNGSFTFLAPGGTLPGGDRFVFVSKGTSDGVAATTSTDYNAPFTAVATGLGNISGDSSLLRINSAQVASSTSDQGTGNYLSYPLFIGSRGGTSLRFNGHLYSLIARFSATNLPDATIAQTETWVNQRTGAY